MKKQLAFFVAFALTASSISAQVEPLAGNWKTWFIASGKEFRLPPPPSGKAEIKEVHDRQQALNSDDLQKIQYFDAGAPGYRWQTMMYKLMLSDTTHKGTLANMLLNVAIYDATVAAWHSKYTYNRSRPYAADKRIKALVPATNSPSYPCEHSVTAGVAAAVIAHFYPALADSVNRMAQRAMASRVTAGAAFPSDTRAGFELGKRVAEAEIAYTKEFSPQTSWNGVIPDGPERWKGKPAYPQAGLGKTIVLDSSSQFRPGPPPSFAKEMEELRNFKPTFRSVSNAYYFASQPVWEDMLHKKIFEYNLNLNPPKAARLYATCAVAWYDGFVACWDAKYTYWGTRPEQLDTTFQPVLFQSPPFPGYPSGHAMMGGIMAELYSDFFPAEKAWFHKKGVDCAESRFQGGIHFRTDNEAGMELGRKVAAAVLKKVHSENITAELSIVGEKTSTNRETLSKTH